MSDVLREYDRDAELYRTFAEKLRSLILEILDARQLSVHSVASRVKSRVSLERKIAGAESKYLGVQDVTDITGVRIITYFADHVDAVATAIRDEFSVDAANSVDKRDALDPDRFGYLSLHYVLSLNEARRNLIEFRRFAELKAEVQIRSILQHAWAEIEHDLGYKTAAGIPRDVRRQFSRLAGLLEIADTEFAAIRTKLQAYEETVPRQITSAPETVLPDKASLRALIEVSEVVREVDGAIAARAETALTAPDDAFLERLTERVDAAQIGTVAQIEHALSEASLYVVPFAAHVTRAVKRSDKMYRGVALLYLTFWRLFAKGGDEAVRRYVDTLTDDNEQRTLLVTLLREAHELAASAK